MNSPIRAATRRPGSRSLRPLAFASLLLLPVLGLAAAAPEPAAAARPDGTHDFDWLPGRWHVQHHRLAKRLAGDHTWVEFDGTSVGWLTLGGLGNVDDNVVNLPSGPYHGETFRTYDPQTRLWSIWWVDGRSSNRLDPPVVGHFEHGIGIFECDDTFEGRPIRVRYRWDITNPDNPRWEQSFSPDGGKTWEVNWRNEFTRAQ